MDVSRPLSAFRLTGHPPSTNYGVVSRPVATVENRQGPSRQTPIPTLRVYPGRAAREKNPVLAETLAR